jgi:1-acyl-sn-glycerol-3-phosphate acyltransferase
MVTSWLKKRYSDFVDHRVGPEFRARSQALAIRQNEYGYDPFGFSRDSVKYGFFIAQWLYRTYFRAETQGIENVPGTGRVLLVANHGGQLPFDGLVLATALFIECERPRIARSMIERYVPTLPFASYILSRWGQIIGTPENCRRLLEDEEAIIVFPEGANGIAKPFSKRYQLQTFGLGFMRLALETNTPILPVAIIGAEEQAPGFNLRPLARALAMPAFPVVPYPPFLPVMPLPVKYRLYFGEPMRFRGDPDEDDDVLQEKVHTVRNSIQSMIHVGLKERRGVFR